MFTRFDFLGESAGPLQALRGDGWDLEGETDWAVRGTHPEVPDEAAARYRLGRVGLLTSRSVRIRFDHSRRPAGS